MESKKITKFTDMRVWQSAHEHVLSVYQLTSSFPKEEVFGLTSQMRRAAVSITSNIAEGFGRRGNQEKLRFYNIAYASAFELQNQLFIARDLRYAAAEPVQACINQSESVQRQLNALTGSISGPTTAY